MCSWPAGELKVLPQPLTLFFVYEQVWKTGQASSPESPRALNDDLPQFSLSPLPYITEVEHLNSSLLPLPSPSPIPLLFGT